MALWLTVVIIGLVIGISGGIIATVGKTDTNDFSDIGSGVAIVGVIIILLGVMTKIRYTPKD